MKLLDFLSQNELSLDQAAGQIGDVSVSGLRKWLASERVPRPDQMRRIFEWTNGAVTPNDFVLDHGSHASLQIRNCGEDGGETFNHHEKSAARLSRSAV